MKIYKSLPAAILWKSMEHRRTIKTKFNNEEKI